MRKIFLVCLALLFACDKEKVEKEAKILKWKFGGKEATISGTDIKITYPFWLGMGMTALTAKATISPNATITPDETLSRDYTNPVKYTIGAEDGTTTKKYTVSVKVDKNGNL